MPTRPNHPRKREQDWQLQDAKARFSEVFRLALESPQRITRHGKEAVVVIPAEEYERLSGRKARRGDLVSFLAQSPLARYEVELERERDFGRPVAL
jgi:antitoxin Phd